MSLNLVSPGVKVREVDLTIGRVDGANDQVGAIAGPFEKGPVDVPVLIETEQDLLATFGKPLSTDGQYGYWLSASNFLSYGGVLRVLRCDEGAGSYLNNANSSVASPGEGATGVKIKSYQNYVDDYQTTANESLSFKFAAKDPGSWANGLKVCTIDAFADQIITLTGVSTANIPNVGYGITQAIGDRIDVGSGSTSLYSGFMRGVITGISSATGTTAGTWDVDLSVKIADRVSNTGVSSALSYGELQFKAATSTTVVTSTSIGSTLGATNELNDITITGISTENLNGGTDDIALGDVVTVTGGTGITIGAGATVIGIGLTAITVDRAITGIGTTAYTISRPQSTTTNINQLYSSSPTASDAWTITSSTNKDWYNEQKLGLTNSDVYWKSIAEKPGTSQYSSERSGKNDEIHIAVVDESGSISGIAGNVLEKFTYLSKAKDGKISPAESTYFKDRVAQNSQYIYVGYSTDGVASGLTDSGDNDYKFTGSGVGNVGSDAQGVTFAVSGATTDELKAGKNYTSGDGFGVLRGDVINSYNVLKNPAEYSVDFLINGPSGGSAIWDSQAKAKALIAIAELRKDCIAVISPHRAGVVGQANPDTQTDNIIEFYDNLQSSSYAVFDTGYKYQYDRWNNEYRWLPTNADVAGLMAKTSINSFPWFSPAGTSRGALNGAVKLAYNPSQAQRDLLYPKRINPIVAQPGSGIILFGDRTGLATASAFDRINVRRLFLTIEETIGRAAKDQLFEFNDVITRSSFLNVVEPYLRDIKAKRGITDYVVVCDETNNTPDIIDSNQFRADIFVKPARSINFIGLTFVATRTGISFEEVVGNV